MVSKKNASCGIYLGLHIWPTIAVELGYGESDHELISGTGMLLEGSRGRIGFVIGVKIECLDLDVDKYIQEGYVELHKYCQNTGKRARVGGRQVSFSILLTVNLSVSLTHLYSVPIPTTTVP